MKSQQYYIDLKLMKKFLTNILDFDVLSKAFDGINVFDFGFDLFLFSQQCNYLQYKHAVSNKWTAISFNSSA